MLLPIPSIEEDDRPDGPLFAPTDESEYEPEEEKKEEEEYEFLDSDLKVECAGASAQNCCLLRGLPGVFAWASALRLVGPGGPEMRILHAVSLSC